MKRSTGLWALMGFAVTSLCGTLLHFLYDWLGEAIWIAPFSGVNESTWEHMKLLFWPMLIFAVAQSFFFHDLTNFWCVKLRGILLGILLIPIIFYTYNGAIGKSPDWINIAIFFISAAVAYILIPFSFARSQNSSMLSTAHTGISSDAPADALATIAEAVKKLRFGTITPSTPEA